MGSVPIHMPKLILVSALIELLGLILMYIIDFDYSFLFLLAGFIYFFVMYARYRNSGARHTYETETKRDVSNMMVVDNFIKHEKGLSNSKITGCNNKTVRGESQGSSVLNKLMK